MNTESRGQTASLKVQLKAAELDFICSLPTTPARYDVLLDKNGKIFRCQIKYCNRSSSSCDKSIEVDLSKTIKGERVGYTSKEIDVLLVYVPRIEEVLWVPKEVFHGKMSLKIKLEKTLAKHGTMARKFIWTR